METHYIISLALIPILVLIIFIYRKDYITSEPIGQILKAFLLGLLSAPLSFVVSVPSEILGLYSEYVGTVGDAVRVSFFGAAIPEEAAKLFILWIVLRKNKYFDEKMDGIVYASCVSLGFAALENLIYLFSDMENYMSIGISRAITAVPAHFCFGIAMGYYYSLAKFETKDKFKNRAMVFLVPVLLHGIYDTILFSTSVIVESFAAENEVIAGILSLIMLAVFISFCFKMWKFASKSIKEHIERDKSDIFKRNKF